MDAVSRPISAFAAELRFEDLPPEIVDRATEHLVDTLACALGGFRSPQAVIGRRLAAGAVSVAGYPAGRVLGTRSFSAPNLAAFANGAAIRNLDFNDTYPGGHPSDCLGAIIALAEHVQADGPRLLTSLVAAYETVVRLIRGTRLVDVGWDQGILISVATAAGLGNLLALSQEQIGHALSIAVTGNVALRVTRNGELSLWKGAATPYAAQAGTLATLVAAEGMTGPDLAFTDEDGLWGKVTGKFALDPFPKAGGDFLLPLVRMKFWPVEYGAQAAVWAALQLREHTALADILSVEIGVTSGTYRSIGSGAEKWDPRSRETADHSLPYVFARALVDGSVGEQSYSDAAVLDPSLRPVMAKLQVHADERCNAVWPSTVLLHLRADIKDGEPVDIEVRNPRGHELNRLTPDEIGQKFRALAADVLTPEHTEAALRPWWELRNFDTLTPLLDLLAAE